MAQNDRALFLYGFDIDNNNKYINFKNAALGPELTAILNIGNYSPIEFMQEVKRAFEVADGISKYTISINRAVSSGTSNNVTITTTSPYLDILFGTGSNAGNAPWNLLGFANSDLTGALSYTGYTNCGTILFPDFPMYDYLGPDLMVINDGVRNISAAGVKESLVFAQMRFFQGQWKFITNFKSSTQLTQWQNFLKYATKQLKFEFTPSVFEDPDTWYKCTLESTAADSNGLGFTLKQMRGEGLYRFYDTGVMKFRVVTS